jgi:hypothetical protein
MFLVRKQFDLKLFMELRETSRGSSAWLTGTFSSLSPWRISTGHFRFSIRKIEERWRTASLVMPVSILMFRRIPGKLTSS